MGHAFGVDQLAQFGAGDHRCGSEDKCGAGGGRHMPFKDRDIEARRGGAEYATGRGETEPFSCFDGQVRQSSVGDHDTLGDTGGARRVDQVGRVLWPQRRRAIAVADRGGRRRRCRRGEGGAVDGEPSDGT